MFKKFFKKFFVVAALFALFLPVVCGDSFDAGTTFKPSLSNCTYVVDHKFDATTIDVGYTCMNVTGGMLAGTYCTVCSTPTNIDFPGYSHSDDPHTDDAVNQMLSTIIVIAGFIGLIVIAGIGAAVYVALGKNGDPLMGIKIAAGVASTVVVFAVAVAILAYLRVV